VAALPQFRAELIVWPETCYPEEWWEAAPDVPPELLKPEWARWVTESRHMANNAPARWPANLLLGLNSRVVGVDGKARRYNSSLLVLASEVRPEFFAAVAAAPDATFPGNLPWAALAKSSRKDAPPLVGYPAGRYDKIHLVPFGEYVPPLPGMSTFAPYDFDYSVTPGEQHTRFTLGPHRFGMVICYEDTDPDLARQYARPGADGSPPVDFLVNTSNDGWFDGTSEHEEHLATARFRAVECRRALVRTVNMGISAVIDGNGRVLGPGREQRLQIKEPGVPKGLETVPVWEVAPGKAAAELPLARWAEFKKTHGVLVADVPIDRRASFYAAWGDWLPWACWAAVALGLLSPAFPLLRRTRE
jgi:apolipoprotein N-acyltransferase